MPSINNISNFFDIIKFLQALIVTIPFGKSVSSATNICLSDCIILSKYSLYPSTFNPVFNAVLENKKLIILNELQSIDSNKYLNSDALKSIITDKKININQKNEPERLTDNVANFIMVSNNSNDLVLNS